MSTFISINLPVHVIAESGGRRSELNLLRDALLFYAEHLREVSNQQQDPNLLVDAANVEDVLENLTQQAFEALSERSQQLATLQQQSEES